MAFPSRNKITATQALTEITNLAARAKGLATTHKTKAIAGTLDGEELYNLFEELRGIHTQMNTLSKTSGLAGFAKEQFNDQNLNIVAEFNTMNTALDAIIVKLISFIPKDADGYVAVKKIEADRTTTSRPYTSKQVSEIRVLLNTLEGLID